MKPISALLSPTRFGVYEFDKQLGELRKRGLKIRLGSQSSRVLSMLLERPGEIRTRDELQQQLWPDHTFVDFERGLYRAVYELRKALGDLARSPRYVETVASHGYRFIPIPQEADRSAARPGISNRRCTLAVLLFASETADPEMEALNETMVEQITDTISSSPGIRVLAHSTVQHCRNKNLDLWTLGRKLSVQMIVTGKMVRRNDLLLLHVELIDVEDGTQLWGAQFRESCADLLGNPDKLADRICGQLRPALAPNVRKKTEEDRKN